MWYFPPVFCPLLFLLFAIQVSVCPLSLSEQYVAPPNPAPPLFWSRPPSIPLLLIRHGGSKYSRYLPNCSAHTNPPLSLWSPKTPDGIIDFPFRPMGLAYMWVMRGQDQSVKYAVCTTSSFFYEKYACVRSFLVWMTGWWKGKYYKSSPASKLQNTFFALREN